MAARARASSRTCGTGAQARAVESPAGAPNGGAPNGGTFRSEAAPGAPTVAAPANDGGQAQMDRLERRVAKLTRLLDDRDEEILSLADRKSIDEAGVASIYQTVQGVPGRGKEAKRRKEFMSKIFEANLKLRERVTSGTPGAE